MISWNVDIKNIKEYAILMNDRQLTAMAWAPPVSEMASNFGSHEVNLH